MYRRYFCRSLLLLHFTAAWIQNPEPRMYTPYNEDQIYKFSGNDSYVDYFKLLGIDADTALIGSRDVVYNISLNNLTENKMERIVWQPTAAHRELCILKGKSEEECHNYVRVGAQIDEDNLLLCGTNAYKPLCRHYNFQDGKKVVLKEMDGQGWCPYGPNHNSSAVYADGHLYIATIADFGGAESIIYRDPLKTETSNLKQLNSANFVSSMSYADYVLFFFREAAVEYINCGKIIYSRVGRVCKRDKGGPHQFGDRWTSFLKARLNCSIPGEYPFYFNEIQSTSEIVEGVYGSSENKMSKIIYGVFTTPANSIGGSAVCAFSLDSIMNVFDVGPFKEQESMNSNWLRVSPSKVPKPRPGQCVNDSRTLPDVSVNFVRTHTLLDEAVPSFTQPLLVRVSLRNRFSAITVDPQVRTITGQPMDVLFIGTDDGKIMKAVNRGGENQRAIFTEEIHIGTAHVAVRSLTIVRQSGEEPKLIIITHDVVHSIPLYRCSKISSCRECVGIQDPYCAWDTQSNACVAHSQYPEKRHFLQNILRGSHSACQPPGHVQSGVADRPLEKTEIDIDDKVGNCPKCSSCNPRPCIGGDITLGTKEKIVIYTADTLGIVVSSSVFATLVIGFVAGYFCSRRFRPDNAYTNMPLHQQHNSINGEGAYLSPCVNNKSINLLVNVPPKNANDKNANTSSENNKSLQKVKKTYI